MQEEENDDVEEVDVDEEDRSQDREAYFARACAGDIRMDISQEPLFVEIYRKMAGDTSGDIILCEPAQSKCTWTFHKSHFVWKFIGKMPNAPDTPWIEHRAFTLTVRIPRCGHTVWGKMVMTGGYFYDCFTHIISNQLLINWFPILKLSMNCNLRFS